MKGRGLPLERSVAEPVNVPVASEKVNSSRLLRRLVTRLFRLNVMASVKLVARLPPVEAVASVKPSTEFVEPAGSV
jgi:hypothetical protein